MTDRSSERLDRKRRAFAVLRDVLDVPESEQAASIAHHCGADLALAAEVRTLLRAERGGVLDRTAGDIASRLTAEDTAMDDLPIGARIGDWTVLRALGSGGMGTVYLAERIGDGYVQQGALKRIKRGMDSAAVLARFRRERQILSRLVHPNIAHLLDGGIGADGRPYFVMEYVAGETLQHWVTRAQPTLAARIAVFMSACEAIAHAHHSLIVHRDIKSENLLVDANGHARVLDFGIATVLDDDASGQRTGTANRFVSRACAAPEQMDGGAVTTATDIFQLGVLLSGLLAGTPAAEPTGRWPFGWLARALVKPADASRDGIRARGFRGDIGVILARATDPMPARRYATVEALMRDVHAWHGGRPIAARADTASYRLRRFIGRHRIATAAAAVALGAILVGSTLALWQAREAAAEARLARSAQAFLISVFDASAPDSAAGERVTARELLDRGSERIEHELADQPRLRGEMLLTLGSLYRQLGQYAQAEHLLESASAAFTDFAPHSASATRVAIELALVERLRGQLNEAEDHLAVAFAADAGDEVNSRVLAERALLREKQGRFDDALADARAAVAIDLARGDAARAEQARDHQIEALVLARLGQFDESTRVFERALASARTQYGDDDTRIALMRNDYALALVEKGHLKEAESELRKALGIFRKRLGDDHPAVAETLQLLGAAMRPQGRFDESQAAFEEALKIQRHMLGNQHTDVANTLNSLGMLNFARRQPAAAERYFREAVTIYQQLGKADLSPAATTANNLATALIQLGRYDEAEPLTRHALDVHLKLFGEQHPVVMADLNSLAQLEMRRDRFDSAIGYARRAAIIADSPASPPLTGAYVHLAFANLLNRAARPGEALQQVDGAIAILARLGAASDPRMPTALATRADALLGLGRIDEAQTLAEQVMARRQQAKPVDTAALIATHALLARCATAHHKSADAVRERATARALLADLPSADPDLVRQIERL